MAADRSKPIMKTRLNDRLKFYDEKDMPDEKIYMTERFDEESLYTKPQHILKTNLGGTSKVSSSLDKGGTDENQQVELQ